MLFFVSSGWADVGGSSIFSPWSHDLYILTFVLTCVWDRKNLLYSTLLFKTFRRKQQSDFPFCIIYPKHHPLSNWCDCDCCSLDTCHSDNAVCSVQVQLCLSPSSSCAHTSNRVKHLQFTLINMFQYFVNLHVFLNIMHCTRTWSYKHIIWHFSCF